jgi:AcrR family transcriptional regulator
MAISSPRRAVNESATRRAIQDAALQLAEQQGMAATTIAQIVEVAGISSRTFFRYCASKEDAAIGDHAERFELFVKLLTRPLGAESTIERCFSAAIEALQPVFAEPRRYRRRYRLVRTDPLLRDRTRVTDATFERAVAEFVRPAFETVNGELHASLFAASGMAAVNATLDGWVDRPKVDGIAELKSAFAEVRRCARVWNTGDRDNDHNSVVVVIARSNLSEDELKQRIVSSLQ